MRNVDVRTGRDELHIASFVVQHRAEAMPALAAHVAATAGMELSLPGEVRSVVLCEGENQYELIDRIEGLRAIDGVINATLVYHHAEPPEALDAPVQAQAGAMP